jgi:hypothetical protein
MKQRILWNVLRGAVGLALVVILYLSLYLMPTLEAINRLERDARDVAQQIADCRRNADVYVRPDQREEDLLQRMDAGMRKRLPVVRSPDDLSALVARFLSRLEALTRRDGVSDLILAAAPDAGLPRPVELLSGNPAIEKELGAFSVVQGDELRKRSAAVFSDPFLNLERVAGQDLCLALSGPLPGLLHFINHLPNQAIPVAVENCRIETGNSFPRVLVMVRLFFLDLRPAVPPSAITGQGPGLIDMNSDLLLRPVYESQALGVGQPELTAVFGAPIFMPGGAAPRTGSDLR